jgi:hypothetical protein
MHDKFVECNLKERAVAAFVFVDCETMFRTQYVCVGDLAPRQISHAWLE